MRLTRSGAGQAAAIVLPAALAAWCGWLIAAPGHHPAAPAAEPHGQVVSCGRPVMPGGQIVGVAPGSPFTPSLLAFIGATGIRPNVVEYYSAASAPFDPARACQVERAGALPLIQLGPRRQDNLRSIISGRDDAQLTAYAQAVRRFRAPVAISFGHEMNGSWYRWGYRHSRPQLFIAAWRHLHDLFTAAGARNVIWVWTVNRNAPGTIPIRLDWPGARYVNWVGLTGYYNAAGDTFRSVFGGSLASIRAITRDPVLITETGVSPRRSAGRQVAGLVARAIRTPGVLGFVWFDINGRERWHLEDDAAALAAFRHAVATPSPR